MKPRLLVVERHHLGDALIAIPFLRGAAKIFDVTVLCRPAVAGLLREADPGLRASSGPVPRLSESDVAVSIWPDTRAHWAMRQSGAGRRIGVPLSERNFYGIGHAWRRRRLMAGRGGERILSVAGALLTESLCEPVGAPRQAALWEKLAQSLNVTLETSPPFPNPGPLPDAVEAFLKDHNGVWVLHPGARLPTKRWPVERFQELLTSFFAPRRIPVVIVQIPGEPAPTPVANDQMVFVPSSISQTAGLFQRASGVLCNDSLASHLASVMNVPVVTLFGSGDPTWFAPAGSPDLVVSSPACPFRPCVDRCVQPSFVCLETLCNHLVEKSLQAAILARAEKPT